MSMIFFLFSFFIFLWVKLYMKLPTLLLYMTINVTMVAMVDGIFPLVLWLFPFYILPLSTSSSPP